MSGWHSGGRIPSRTWERVRRAALDRDGWRCVKCGRAGRLEVDHIIPLYQGGAPVDLDNLQTLCRPCHLAKSGYVNRWDENEGWADVLTEYFGSE